MHGCGGCNGGVNFISDGATAVDVEECRENKQMLWRRCADVELEKRKDLIGFITFYFTPPEGRPELVCTFECSQEIVFSRFCSHFLHCCSCIISKYTALHACFCRS